MFISDIDRAKISNVHCLLYHTERKTSRWFDKGISAFLKHDKLDLMIPFVKCKDEYFWNQLMYFFVFQGIAFTDSSNLNLLPGDSILYEYLCLDREIYKQQETSYNFPEIISTCRQKYKA